MTLEIVAEGLRFPEGPIAMPDGGLIFVEVEGRTLSRIDPSGVVDVIAHFEGCPNGAALGPDGRVYVCNNGGFAWKFQRNGIGRQPVGKSADYSGGRIEAVDIHTGVIETLYSDCDGNSLVSPNDLVFDAHGGIYFTDHGEIGGPPEERTGLYYGLADGSAIRQVAYPVHTPNGIGLSPDEKTLYTAETLSRQLWAFDLAEPGVINKRAGTPHGGWLVGQNPKPRMLDSLAVEANGNICVGTLMDGGITVFSPDGASIEYIDLPDPYYVTNICFGGDDLQTAYITQSWLGQVIKMRWPRPGLALNYLNK